MNNAAPTGAGMRSNRLPAEEADRQAEDLLNSLYELSMNADDQKYYAAAEAGWHALHRRAANRRPPSYPALDLKYAIRREFLRKKEGLSYEAATDMTVREYNKELSAMDAVPGSSALLRVWIERVAGAREKLQGIVEGWQEGPPRA